MSCMGTQNKCLFEVFRDGTCKFTWNGKEIPYIGRYSGLLWHNFVFKDLDAQAVFPLSTGEG